MEHALPIPTSYRGGRRITRICCLWLLSYCIISSILTCIIFRRLLPILWKPWIKGYGIPCSSSFPGRHTLFSPCCSVLVFSSSLITKRGKGRTSGFVSSGGWCSYSLSVASTPRSSRGRYWCFIRSWVLCWYRFASWVIRWYWRSPCFWCYSPWNGVNSCMPWCIRNMWHPRNNGWCTVCGSIRIWKVLAFGKWSSLICGTGSCIAFSGLGAMDVSPDIGSLYAGHVVGAQGIVCRSGEASDVLDKDLCYRGSLFHSPLLSVPFPTRFAGAYRRASPDEYDRVFLA